MFKRNLGRFDRAARLVIGLALIPIGLFLLGGWQGRAGGIVVAALAIIPLGTSLIGSCPLYVPFGISTSGKK